MLLKALHPGQQDYDFDGTEAHLIYIGPCHQIGNTLVRVPKESVVFAGDVMFRQCTPNTDRCAGSRTRYGIGGPRSRMSGPGTALDLTDRTRSHKPSKRFRVSGYRGMPCVRASKQEAD